MEPAQVPGSRITGQVDRGGLASMLSTATYESTIAPLAPDRRIPDRLNDVYVRTTQDFEM